MRRTDRQGEAELLGASAHGAAWPRGVLLALAAAWTLWIWKDASLAAGQPGSGFLHMALLPFHEAGHVFLRPFGAFLHALGGTLGQHALPIVAGIALLRRGDAFGAALCAWLLGFSTIDMAVYMHDAFDPRLTLLDGRTGAESDGHDWQNVFGDLGLLKRARGIARFFALLGALGMAAGLAWGALALRKRAPFTNVENAD